MIYIETGSTDVYYNFGLEYYFAAEKRLPDRMSGGGTIYTDLGGWQFTFIEHSPEQQIEFTQ